MGNFKKLPVVERITLGEYKSTQFPNRIIPSIPNAVALLIIVPKLPGSLIESKSAILFKFIKLFRRIYG